MVNNYIIIALTTRVYYNVTRGVKSLQNNYLWVTIWQLSARITDDRDRHCKSGSVNTYIPVGCLNCLRYRLFKDRL